MKQLISIHTGSQSENRIQISDRIISTSGREIPKFSEINLTQSGLQI